MRRFLTAVLFGALAAAAPTAAQAQYVSAQSQAVVADWYSRFLHRPSEPAALGWAQALDQGQNPNKLLAGIVGSDEYYSRCGSTPEGYVQTLFTDVNGRQPSRAEYEYWGGRLVRAGGRAPEYEVRVDFAYTLLARYPQNWQAAAPVVAPTIVVPPVYNYGRSYGNHDDYEYRRPYVPSVRWDHDHREEHDRHEERDRRR
ncbi:MAG TPA: hypothetical protein DDY78_05150 [Planctomycetales bacterium]|jgi:hypothetical protein|nr:hypothetical protein [Planctomycetales bacterium]